MGAPPVGLVACGAARVHAALADAGAQSIGFDMRTARKHRSKGTCDRCLAGTRDTRQEDDAWPLNIHSEESGLPGQISSLVVLRGC